MRDWQEFVREHLPLEDLAPERQARIVRELAAQLEDFYHDALAGGFGEGEADAFARRQIRDWTRFASEVRAADRPNVKTYLELLEDHAAQAAARSKGRRWSLVSDFIGDLRYALRQLRKSPGFTLVAVLTLALGIGATTAVFSVVHGVLLRPFPYKDPDHLAVISLTWPGGRFWLSEKDILTVREQATLFEGVAAVDETEATLLGGSEPEQMKVALVSANFFPVLGIQPAIGRSFTPEEEVPSGPPVVIISHELWQRRFGGSTDVLGKVLEFDGARPQRVIGVMPRAFRVVLSVNADFHKKADLWYPHQVDYATVKRGRNLIALARLKQGVSWAAAQEELTGIAKGYFTFPGTQNTFQAFPLQADAVREVRGGLLTALAATGFVLLIACANIANLLLARGATRQHELAVRSSLGATPFRLIRQSLVESCVLAVLGGGSGILLAWFIVHYGIAFLPSQFPRVEAIGLNPTVLGVSLALVLAAGVFFGLLPALRASHTDANTTFRQCSRGRAGSVPRLFRKVLVVGEIAICLILLAGGALFFRSFLALQASNPGFNPASTLTFSVSLPPRRYAEHDKRVEFFRGLQDRLAGLPGVDSVSANMVLPFGRSLSQNSFTFYRDNAESVTENALIRPVLPGYFETLQVRLLAGRFFTSADNTSNERVGIIDETLAQSAWPDQSVLGKRFARGPDPTDPQYITVVGVVENQRVTSLIGKRDAQVYLPVQQISPEDLSYVLRTRLDPALLIEPVREQVRALDPNIAVFDIGQLDQALAAQRAPQRLTSILMACLAGIGLLLAMVGVFGVISYAVNQQTHEFGVRMALGAQRSDIYRMVLSSGAKLAALGVLIGVGGSIALSRTIDGLLYGVSARDPSTVAVVSFVLIAAALAACYLPARRATRADPLAALRHE